MPECEPLVTQPIPITVLTGFLGSGKTTLLARLLADPTLRDTAVLVNEVGEIGLDHQLLYGASETIVLMDRGCLCCALRSDLAEQLDDLYLRRMRKEVPAFARVVIETTGLADPGPILQTLAADRTIAALYRLERIVTTIDGELGERTLDEHFESVKQAAVADLLVITKTDRADGQMIERLTARLKDLNPGAHILASARGEVNPGDVIDMGATTPAHPLVARHWLRAERYVPASVAPAVINPGASTAHDQRIRSFAIEYDEPVSGKALWAGLERLIDDDGDKLLRVKGIVNVAGLGGPRVIHIVQHVLYPVTSLPKWPDDDRRTRLVFIVRDLQPANVRAILDGALAEAA